MKDGGIPALTFGAIGVYAGWPHVTASVSDFGTHTYTSPYASSSYHNLAEPEARWSQHLAFWHMVELVVVCVVVGALVATLLAWLGVPKKYLSIGSWGPE
ncbi:MAG: hypothetical protein QOJ29_4290 [Thermoleophilaceae bacterium]|nr:hypothetical protein [Thermoleophilaceae bacterium]